MRNKQWQKVTVMGGEIVDNCGHMHDAVDDAAQCDGIADRWDNTGPAFERVVVDQDGRMFGRFNPE